MFVGRARYDGPDKLGISIVHSANSESRLDRARATSNSKVASQGATPGSSAPLSPGATDFRDCWGPCLLSIL